MKTRRISSSLVPLAMSLAAPLNAAVTCPNDFEIPSNALGPIYAFFGGVTSWGASPSSVPVHSGQSLEVWANLIDDGFSAAGFAVGTFGISAPNLNVPPTAAYFSVTIQSPSNGQLSVKITLREDDNNDGVINAGSDDDQWESNTYMLLPGTNVYNMPLSTFEDLNPDTGNDTQNFTTTGRLAYFLTFESRDAYPGGQIIGPVSVHVDHVGLYTDPQTIPSPTNPADIDGDGSVGVPDLLAVINQWGVCGTTCTADISPQPSGDGVIGVPDLLAVINNWG